MSFSLFLLYTSVPMQRTSRSTIEDFQPPSCQENLQPMQPITYQLLPYLYFHYSLLQVFIQFPPKPCKFTFYTTIPHKRPKFTTNSVSISLYKLPDLSLPDKDFQIKDLSTDRNNLKVFFQSRDNYLNGSNILRLWECNLPMYFLPPVHIFPDIIHQFQANYDPNIRAIIYPSQIVLFPITAQSINEMLQLHSNQALTPISMGYLLEESTQLYQLELKYICQTFMSPKHQLDGPPSYMQTFFTDMGQLVINMISLIMGSTLVGMLMR